MYKDINLLIGGIQGDGIVSSAIILMRALSSLGYYTYGSRNFSSRIKGGHNSIVINVSTDKSLSVSDGIDIILAMDIDTSNRYRDRLKNNGMIIYDSSIRVEDSHDKQLLSLPIKELLNEGNVTMIKNTFAIGFLAKLLGIHFESLEDSIIKKYRKKTPDIINQNLMALKAAYSYGFEVASNHDYQMLPVEKIHRPLMMGNEAIAFGALMGGCRFMSAYPITPASEIMEILGAMLPKYKGMMLQVEDEISAINMAIGASYSGVRSITATSGPGFSLMQEGIGLAGMAEIPIVIVNSQRVGPSTGIPTKHEQSDLFTCYYGGHGEYPSIILTPSTVEDCFYDTIRGFNLAYYYQCPVILLLDLSLSLSPQTIEPLQYEGIAIDEDKKASSIGKPYQFAQDNISPRMIPGFYEGTHHVTGLEHDELGLPCDDSLNRRKMMDKRLNKLTPLSNGEEITLHKNNQERVLILAFGSNYGVVKKAIESNGSKYDYGYFRMIKPLPSTQLRSLLSYYEKVILIENNYNGQLAKIIKGEIGFNEKIYSITKYDGTVFTPEEILIELGGLLNG